MNSAWRSSDRTGLKKTDPAAMQRQPERIAASFGHFIARNQAAAIACIYPFAAFASGGSRS
jgi:hypothetical protein